MRKLLSYILIASFGVFLTACWDNVDDFAGSGTFEDPTLAVVVTDASGSTVSGATVDVYPSYSVYASGGTKLGSGTTDASGTAVFGTDVLGSEASSFYFSVYTSGYALTNWSNTRNTAVMLLNSGQTTVSVGLSAPTYSVAIDGPDEVVSGTAGVVFDVADYPGTYTWTITPETGWTANALNQPILILDFAQSPEDETYTVTLDYAVGSETGTFETEVFAARFCDYDETAWGGLGLAGVDPCWNLNVVDVAGTGIVIDGTTMTFPADANGNPYFLNNIFAGWGETFQPGFGNEGDIIAELDPDGTFVISAQYMGQTLPGPYDYWFRGSGIFDQCTNTMTLQTWDFSYDEFASAWYGAASGCVSPWILAE